ncbi:hypothetical protein D3C81_1698640 [compost metagenome]
MPQFGEVGILGQHRAKPQAAFVGLLQVAQRQRFIAAASREQRGYLVGRAQLVRIFAAGGQVQRQGLQLVAVFHRIGAFDQLLRVVGIDQRIDHRAQRREVGLFVIGRVGGMRDGRAQQQGCSHGKSKQRLHADLP